MTIEAKTQEIKVMEGTKVVDGVVVIRTDVDGDVSYFVVAENVNIRLFMIDERAKNDRVYEWLSRDSGDVVRELLGPPPYGSNQDERHPAIAASILEIIDGRPRLSLVTPEQKDTP